MASAAGLAPAASTFAKWRSNLTELRGQTALSLKMVSVIGLAPIMFDLKGRSLELLCIHGDLKWLPRLVSRQRLLVFSEALICLSYLGNYTNLKASLDLHTMLRLDDHRYCADVSYRRHTWVQHSPDAPSRRSATATFGCSGLPWGLYRSGSFFA